MKNPLAKQEWWELVYAECRDEYVWAFIGPPEVHPQFSWDEPKIQPWKLAEDDPPVETIFDM